MGNYLSCNILNGCMFVENVAEKVGVVAKGKTTSCIVGSMENGVLM